MSNSLSPPRAAPRSEQIGRLIGDIADRRARGEPFDAERIIVENPELATDLRADLSALGFLCAQDESIGRLIQRGVLERSDDERFAARLGRYQVSRVLGVGAMGVVLAAFDEKLGRPVALKLLRSDLVHDRVALLRFTREARAAGGLAHPNIVTVYDVGEHGGVHYIAMEHVDGPTLADVLRARPRPLDTGAVRAVVRQLLSGLAAAHAAGVVHRDIKPSNILIGGWERRAGASNGSLDFTSDSGGPLARPASPTDPPAHRPASGRPQARPPASPAAAPGSPDPPRDAVPLIKIADFGVALTSAAQTRLTLTNAMPGTLQYMSPEQVRGDGVIDARTDLYSAGVVLYEMLTGRLPHRAATTTELLYKIAHATPPPPTAVRPGVDRALAALAMRLMVPVPADRLTSALAALRELDAPPRRLVRAIRRIRRRPIVAAVWVAGAMMAGWLSWQLLAPRRIWEVKVDRESANVIWVRYTFGVPWWWWRFKTFGEGVQVKASLADPDGRGNSVVVVASHGAQDDEGSVLAAYDASGKQLWCNGLHRAPWIARSVTCANLDGDPGDEVVCAFNDPDEHPTEVALVDATDGETRGTFEHPGHLTGVLVWPRYFSGDRPAIVLWGQNNRLDGATDPVKPGDKGFHQYTQYAQVPVTLVVDPIDMGGSGPSWLEPVPACVEAYAYFDAPASTSEYWDEKVKKLVHADTQACVTITNVELTENPGGAPTLKITTEHLVLFVDRGLSRTAKSLGSGSEPWMLLKEPGGQRRDARPKP